MPQQVGCLAILNMLGCCEHLVLTIVTAGVDVLFGGHVGMVGELHAAAQN